MNDRTPAETLAAVSYRCVCGESFALLPGEHDARCPNCDRHYAAEAFQRAAAETLSMSAADGIALRASPLAEAAEATGDGDEGSRVGEQIDHFRIVSLLGRGGMGDVYKAVDESLQRYVALKVISTVGDSSQGSTRAGKIVEEARAQARVSHPNVVHIYYVGRDENSPFFAMELIEGETLAEQVEKQPLTFAEVVSVALQVVDALEQAAAFDIVHGDIKPSNILMARSQGGAADVVKLSDFGLAQRISQADEQSHSITGTPDYLSPEAARGEPLKQQSDMYSLGVMLFQLTFGRLPYPGDTTSLVEKLELHKSAPVEFPDPWPARIPEPWRDLLQRLMAKEAGDRFANYDQLRRELRKLQPIALPKAGWMPRGVAWIVDLGLALTVYVFTFVVMHAGTAAFEMNEGMPRLSWLQFLIAVASLTVPAAAAGLQALWGTTPGKKMFQLRMVTDYGLQPPARILAVRGLFQFMPLTLMIVSGILSMMGLPLFVLFVVGTGMLFLTLDTAMALFHPGGRSLHDWALHTQVVLDAPQS